MHPLTRQRTLESVLSWWSDRNPPGPTINLHAASKPLMKFLYHRQVLGFIEKNRGTPLSTGILEIYSSYLTFNYVSPSTKTAILRYLGERAFASEDDARALVDSNVWDIFISWWSDTNPPGSKIDLHVAYKPLMGLLYHGQALGFIDKNHDIPLSREILEIYHSYLASEHVSPSTNTAILMELCTRVSQSGDEARVVLDSVVFNQAAELLESPERQIRQLMCRMVGRLAYHIPTTSDISPCV
ncbi:hypothetical protein C8R44DRAFT_444605 [Mycena epipterygia]|nr:hypothetical protein C8R44DRAFT_444605 [Mycena epipterygia]